MNNQKPKISILEKLMVITNIDIAVLICMVVAGIIMFTAGGPLILSIGLTSMAAISGLLGVTNQLIDYKTLLDGKLKGNRHYAKREVKKRRLNQEKYKDGSILRELFNILGAALLIASIVIMFMSVGLFFGGIFMGTIAIASILFEFTSIAIKIGNNNSNIGFFRTGGRKLGGRNVEKSRLLPDDIEKNINEVTVPITKEQKDNGVKEKKIEDNKTEENREVFDEKPKVEQQIVDRTEEQKSTMKNRIDYFENKKGEMPIIEEQKDDEKPEVEQQIADRTEEQKNTIKNRIDYFENKK